MRDIFGFGSGHDLPPTHIVRQKLGMQIGTRRVKGFTQRPFEVVEYDTVGHEIGGLGVVNEIDVWFNPEEVLALGLDPKAVVLRRGPRNTDDSKGISHIMVREALNTKPEHGPRKRKS